jgi:hypothetical protein
MEKLPPAVFKDISEHATDRVFRALSDVVDQLVEDPEQRAALACALATRMLMFAAGATSVAYEEQYQRPCPRRHAILAILKRVMENEGIEFEEIERDGISRANRQSHD